MARQALVLALIFVAVVGAFAAEAPSATPSTSPSPKASVPSAKAPTAATPKASARAPSVTEAPKHSASSPVAEEGPAGAPKGEISSPPAPASLSAEGPGPAAGPIADIASDAPATPPAPQKDGAATIKISTAAVVAGLVVFLSALADKDKNLVKKLVVLASHLCEQDEDDLVLDTELIIGQRFHGMREGYDSSYLLNQIL
ncbi:hypothetical protein DKX38_025338 [Salix brachista]|uniref:Uncharacterized protein n=1 Tax=Salix brachista TaxID=2182728 RepID=A0A5N5JP92_9ROSI|nr:hypothetical protein DKX38_025338 [Salix brachista]